MDWHYVRPTLGRGLMPLRNGRVLNLNTFLLKDVLLALCMVKSICGW